MRPLPTLACALTLASFIAISGCKPPGPKRPLNPQEQRGEQIFKAYCAQCHDPYSRKPRAGPGLRDLFDEQYLPASGAPANDERVRDAIQMGRRNMPPFGNILNEQQMQDLLAYLHAL